MRWARNLVPITATTFVIMYKQPKNIDRAAVAMDFFRWALDMGNLFANSSVVARPAKNISRASPPNKDLSAQT